MNLSPSRCHWLRSFRSYFVGQDQVSNKVMLSVPVSHNGSIQERGSSSGGRLVTTNQASKSGSPFCLDILCRLPHHTGLSVNPIPLGSLRSRNLHLKPINDLEPEFLVHGDRDVGALQIDGQPVCRSQLENPAGEEGAGTLTLACRVRANEAQAWAGSRLARGSVSSGPGGEKIGAPTPAGRAED